MSIKSITLIAKLISATKQNLQNLLLRIVILSLTVTELKQATSPLQAEPIQIRRLLHFRLQFRYSKPLPCLLLQHLRTDLPDLTEMLSVYRIQRVNCIRVFFQRRIFPMPILVQFILADLTVGSQEFDFDVTNLNGVSVLTALKK